LTFSINALMLISFLVLRHINKKSWPSNPTKRFDRPLLITSILASLFFWTLGSMFWAEIIIPSIQVRNTLTLYIFFKWVIEYALGFGLFSSLLLYRLVRLYQQITVTGTPVLPPLPALVLVLTPWILTSVLVLLFGTGSFTFNTMYGMSFVMSFGWRFPLALLAVSYPIVALVLLWKMGNSMASFSSNEEPLAWICVSGALFVLIDAGMDFGIPGSMQARLATTGLVFLYSWVISAAIWRIVTKEQLIESKLFTTKKPAEVALESKAQKLPPSTANEAMQSKPFGADPSEIPAQSTRHTSLASWLRGKLHTAQDHEQETSDPDYIKRRERIEKYPAVEDTSLDPETLEDALKVPPIHTYPPEFMAFHKPPTFELDNQGQGRPPATTFKQQQYGRAMIEKDIIPALTENDRKRISRILTPGATGGAPSTITTEQSPDFERRNLGPQF
jgi:hypothetical protein